MPQCSVPNCTKRNGFTFPDNEKVLKQWVIAIKRESKDHKLWIPTKHARVCQRHFADSDYVSSDTKKG